jgi:regulator of protease activity HflC (stomatin/prohibitin superfamily)
MRRPNFFATLMFFIIFGLGLIADFTGTGGLFINGTSFSFLVLSFVVAFIIAYSIKIADQWEKTVVLRLGKFHSLRGPGLFFIIPVVDTVPFWIDTRVNTTSFTAEKTLTKDTVPVNVDAVLFWKVLDPKMAALNVANYESALGWASKTALRDVIGKTMLSDMLEGRDKLGKELLRIIDNRTEPWGISVISVEVKDVLIPAALEDAMSMQAQAERERQARVILGDSERQVATKFADAAQTYIENPVALHLRAMNMLYEGLKQNSTIVVVPSTAVESMELGNIAGITALAKELKRERKEKAQLNGQNQLQQEVENIKEEELH